MSDDFKLRNPRREEAKSDLDLTSEKENIKMEQAVQEEEKRQQAKNKKRSKLEASVVYGSIKKISKMMDDYFLDPIIGLLPGVGDFFTPIFAVPFVYVSMFEIKSVPLTLAIIYNTVFDILVGMIPLLGIVIDAFNKGFRKNMRLITGFVEDDRTVINEVNRKAVMMVVLICLVCLAIYALVRFAFYALGSAFDFVQGLVQGFI
jgi:hypothetical protein